MIFGSVDQFGIEIGDIERYPNVPGLWVQFRFWISHLQVGNWDDRIPLQPSMENARCLNHCAELRRDWLFDGIHPTEVFRSVYDAFFATDYTVIPHLIPNLRDRFHLDDIGLGAVQDKYGLVLVASTNDLERVIVKDLVQDQIIADVAVPFGLVESVTAAYIESGKSQC